MKQQASTPWPPASLAAAVGDRRLVDRAAGHRREPGRRVPGDVDAIDSTEAVVNIINRAAPYYVAGVAVAIGFKMGLFNIGADGQYRSAALLAAAAGAAVSACRRRCTCCSSSSSPWSVGGAYAGIAGVLKVTRGVNEVDLDDHAQLHRHRHHARTCWRSTCGTRPASSSRRPSRSRGPAGSRRSTGPELDRLPLRGRRDRSRASCRRRPHRGRLLPRCVYRSRFGFDLRVRRQPPRPPSPAASTRTP